MGGERSGVGERCFVPDLLHSSYSLKPMNYIKVLRHDDLVVSHS